MLIFFDCFHQLLHLFFQFTQEFVICPDLAVQFAAVRNNSHGFQFSCVVSFVYGWLFS